MSSYKLHWYSFTAINEQGGICRSESGLVLKDKITTKIINEIEKRLTKQYEKKYIVTSWFYCGYMTKKEFIDE